MTQKLLKISFELRSPVPRAKVRWLTPGLLLLGVACGGKPDTAAKSNDSLVECEADDPDCTCDSDEECLTSETKEVPEHNGDGGDGPSTDSGKTDKPTPDPDDDGRTQPETIEEGKTANETETDAPEVQIKHYSLFINGPSRRTSSRSIVPLSGRVTPLDGAEQPTSVSWESGEVSGNVSLAADGTFSIALVLESGDNNVVFRVPESESMDTVTIVINDDYEFTGALTLPVDVAYVGELRDATAEILLEDPKTVPGSARLVRVEGDNETIVATLTDDGNLENHDEIEGDGVYSGAFLLDETEPGEHFYRVVVDRTDTGEEARSEVADVLVTEHLAPQEIANMVESMASLTTNFEKTADRQLALQGSLSALADNPDITQSATTAAGNGAWFVFGDGILGAITEQEAGTKGGSRRGPPSESKELDGAFTALQAESSGPSIVGSSKSLVIAAQYFDWGDGDDIPQIADALSDSCHSVTYKTYGSRGEGDLEDFKRWGNYGIVAVSSHGNALFQDIEVDLQGRFSWKPGTGQVAMDSNMGITAARILEYEDDLHRGRITLWNDVFGILPGFFERYSGKMANTVVYASICRGAHNSTLADVFLSMGASAFLGYTDVVDVSFCEDNGPALFDQLLQGTTLNEAFIPGRVETDNTPAEFVLVGNSHVKLPIGLNDSSFELGRTSQAWEVAGDARAIKKLGDALPTDGEWMSVVSTGLGFNSDSGTLGQTFCLCNDATAVTWDWNFFSEEWLEYVGNGFQDSFSVSLKNDVESDDPPVFDETIDSLAAEVFPVSNNFDRGDVYATGWRTESAPIDPDWAGKKARLEFFVTDDGDSIFDSAVLIDNVRVEGCAE